MRCRQNALANVLHPLIGTQELALSASLSQTYKIGSSHAYKIVTRRLRNMEDSTSRVNPGYKQNLIDKLVKKPGLRGKVDANCIPCIYDPSEPIFQWTAF